MAEALYKPHGERVFQRISLQEALKLEKQGKAYRPSMHQPGVFYGKLVVASEPVKKEEVKKEEVKKEEVKKEEVKKEKVVEPPVKTPTDQTYKTRDLVANRNPRNRKTT